ncbi:hypothetical protein LP420_18455 [Massilia sp. B-10]|nr:hypothetical protein LP420_18455 [Massilia sp. B-10]
MTSTAAKQQHHVAAGGDHVAHAAQRALALLDHGAAVGHEGEARQCAFAVGAGGKPDI